MYAFSASRTSMPGLAPVEREGVRQKIIDRLLLLYLYFRVSESSRITGDVKLQKLAFLSEKSMIERQANGFHYKFFRWEHGPMSKEVYEDREYLEENELVSDYTGKINKRGREVIDQAEEVLLNNSDFIQDIDSVIEEFGNYSGAALKNIVYDVEVTPLTMARPLRVEDIPPTTDIFFSIPEELAEEHFDISDDWIETLDILMNDESRESLDRSIKMAQRSNGRQFSFSHIDPQKFSPEEVAVEDVSHAGN